MAVLIKKYSLFIFTPIHNVLLIPNDKKVIRITIIYFSFLLKDKHFKQNLLKYKQLVQTNVLIGLAEPKSELCTFIVLFIMLIKYNRTSEMLILWSTKEKKIIKHG